MFRKKCSHAMGLQVRNGVGICSNNGYVGGSSSFRVDNLAKQMIGCRVMWQIYVEWLFKLMRFSCEIPFVLIIRPHPLTSSMNSFNMSR